MSTVSDQEPTTEPLPSAKPPFLRRVQIRGYKSIAFCDVTLEPLTLLVGRNASGKSNFLDALAFLRDIVKFGVNEAVKRHGGAQAILCRMRDDRIVSLGIECEFSIPGDADPHDASYSIDLEFPNKRSARISREELAIGQEGYYHLGYTNEGGQVTCGARGDATQHYTWSVRERPFLDAYNDTPVPEFLDCLEAISAYNFYPDAIRRVQKPNPGWFLERDGSNLASAIETTRENDEKTIERVGRYLSVIAGSVELLGVATYGDYETIRFRIARHASRGPLDFDAASMSDGTLRALAALVADYQIVLPHGYPSLVAIEEPETALHPAAMRALVDALDEATLRTQILLTTHSAEMLDNPTIRPENIRLVQLIDGQTVIGPVDEASVEIVRQKLDTLDGLERQNQLQPDLDDRERQQHLSRNGSESQG